MEDQVLFEMPVELELRKSADGGRRIVRGYASTETIDQDGETILQRGIDFSPLLKSGFINYDHQFREIAGAKLPIIIGYPISAEVRDKGLWLESELFKSTDAGGIDSEQLRLADEMWAMGMAFQKSGGKRKLAYSVEGGALYRDPKNTKKISKSIVRHCALTHRPVNEEATVELFAKSLCCGRCNPNHPEHKPGHACGTHNSISKEDIEDIAKAMSTTSAGPLMLENLDCGLTSVLYGPAECSCYDRQTGKFSGGINGAVEHLQKCQNYDKQQSINFMRRLLHNAPTRPDVAALISSAGFAQNQ